MVVDYLKMDNDSSIIFELFINIYNATVVKFASEHLDKISHIGVDEQIALEKQRVCTTITNYIVGTELDAQIKAMMLRRYIRTHNIKNVINRVVSDFMAYSDENTEYGDITTDGELKILSRVIAHIIVYENKECIHNLFTSSISKNCSKEEYAYTQNIFFAFFNKHLKEFDFYYGSLSVE